MNNVRRDLGLPLSLGYKVTGFPSEGDVLVNLELIDKNTTLFSPCLIRGAGTYIISVIFL